MVMPKSLAAFSDCEELFERALAQTQGIRLRMENKAGAVKLRQRLHTYRSKYRERSQIIYAVEDANYGTSPYDNLQVCIDPADPTIVSIIRTNLKILAVEDI